jgi:hypothetical protein
VATSGGRHPRPSTHAGVPSTIAPNAAGGGS